ncbi:uncharacterized protein Triagg1_194 [Trichoderma aggressivum f. europaeum]|uniref:Uncharacterized protein n=1 Tax=Trichoderma aggressivum f. europaeum TaxID=173218 RepID=A0AAE1JFA1_9HYPO|nr:hypothetical protein Triagg1_194 [Trichoderma aggressivum f. europaeum]
MHQQNILNTSEAATPNSGKKRAFLPDDEVLDNDDSKKRRYAQDDVRAAGRCGSNMRFGTTQPALTASEHRGRSDELQRGRTRWREGSEPPNWDCREFHERLSMVASYDDSAGAERNPFQDSETRRAIAA